MYFVNYGLISCVLFLQFRNEEVVDSFAVITSFHFSVTRRQSICVCCNESLFRYYKFLPTAVMGYRSNSR